MNTAKAATSSLIIWSIFLAGISNVGGASVGLALFADSTLGWGLTSTSHRIPGFDISIFTGDLVRISLVSTDESLHNFGLDYNGNGQPDEGEPFSGDFSGTILYEFGATDKHGEYTYMCFLHPNTMFGRFNVYERGPTTLGVSPAEIEPVLGSSVQVAFYVTNVQDLYTFKIRASFDPTVAQVTDMSLKGTWLEAIGIPYAPSPSNFWANNTVGEINMEVWIQGTFPGWTGSGTVAFVNFTSKASGRSVIEIDDSATTLLDSQFHRIAYTTVDGNEYLFYGLTGAMTAVVLASALYLNRRRRDETGKGSGFPNS